MSVQVGRGRLRKTSIKVHIKIRIIGNFQKYKNIIKLYIIFNKYYYYLYFFIYKKNSNIITDLLHKNIYIYIHLLCIFGQPT